MNRRQYLAIRYGLVFTTATSAIGLVAWCIIGFMQLFNLGAVPHWLIIAGCVFVAIGSEIGSPFQVIEAMRRTGKLDAWGVIGFALSQASTASSVLFGAAMLTTQDTAYLEVMRRYGALFNTLLVTLDANFNSIALALHLFHTAQDEVATARNAAHTQQELEAIQYERQRLHAERAAWAMQQAMADSEHVTGKMDIVTPAPVAVQEAQPVLVAAVLHPTPGKAAQRIADYRAQRPGATQAEVSRELGLARSTVSRNW